MCVCACVWVCVRVCVSMCGIGESDLLFVPHRRTEVWALSFLVSLDFCWRKYRVMSCHDQRRGRGGGTKEKIVDACALAVEGAWT